MRVFVTGATGFVGFAVTEELLGAGYEVLGLARSEAGAASLAKIGAQVQRGDLTDLGSLQAGAERADAVIHCAFNHDFTRFAASCAEDHLAIEAMGNVLAGSQRALIVTAGIGKLAQGRSATEEDAPMPVSAVYPRASEHTAVLLAERGVHASVVRLPQVHDPVKQGFVSYLIELAREKGVSAYVGDGANRWAAVHQRDAARVYRLALEKQTSKFVAYHAVGEEGVPMKAIAEAIGRGLGVPVRAVAPDQAPEHFAFLGYFAGLDMPASSTLTQQRLGWTPTGPGLLADLAAMQF